jgi:hypothetical protein
MRTHLLTTVLIAVGLALPAAAAFSQVPGNLSRNSLIDVMVWESDVTIDWTAWTAYSPKVRAEAHRHRQRFQAYRTSRRPPRGSPELKMVYAARLGYERLLAAASNDRRARTMAADFVERLKPCYEWEGYHDCPEHEARFDVSTTTIRRQMAPIIHSTESNRTRYSQPIVATIERKGRAVTQIRATW